MSPKSATIQRQTLRVQAALEPIEAMQLHALAENVQKLLEAVRRKFVAVHFILRALAIAAVHQSELVRPRNVALHMCGNDMNSISTCPCS